MIMNLLFKRLFCLLAVFGLGATLLSPCPAGAWGPFSRKPPEDPAEAQVRTFQPPPENAVAMYCEPYRREAAQLSQKRFPVAIVYAPRRAWLIRQHRRCRQELMAQEHLYLKHVDREQPATPPKVRTEAPAGRPQEEESHHAGQPE